MQTIRLVMRGCVMEGIYLVGVLVILLASTWIIQYWKAM